MKFDGLKKKLILSGLFMAVVLIEGSSVKADFVFGKPENLGSPPNSNYHDLTPTITSDGLEVYFWSNRSGGYGSWDLWNSTRASLDDQWLPATNPGSKINTSGIEALPCISPDGLELYFSRGAETVGELMVSRRNDRMSSWDTAQNLGPVVNSSVRDDSPAITSDGLELYFISNRVGGHGLSDIWVASRPTTKDDWDTPVNVSIVNSSSYDQWVNISGDDLTLLFQSTRPGSEYGGVYISRRKSKNNPWTTPVYLDLPINDSIYTLLSNVSTDGKKFYLSDHINYAPRAGGHGNADMWQVSIVPVVDFNADGFIDVDDMCIMVNHWGTDNKLCDIGPMPWGDGIVDVQDLIMLAEHLFEEIYPPELIAYWKLDETEGDIAYNSTSDNHGILSGSPIWQPETGKINGALEFDGIDDYIETDFVLNPADGPFSLLAWIKGGAPGQAIISQTDGTGAGEIWLGAEASTGILMTGLVPPPVGRFVPKPLESETIITDGQWHHVGFVWDGSYRSLYVNGVEVAKDTAPQNPLKSATGGLYIGAGKNLGAGTLFYGLIDDVRIYNIALTAEAIAALAQ